MGKIGRKGKKGREEKKRGRVKSISFLPFPSPFSLPFPFSPSLPFYPFPSFFYPFPSLNLYPCTSTFTLPSPFSLSFLLHSLCRKQIGFRVFPSKKGSENATIVLKFSKNFVQGGNPPCNPPHTEYLSFLYFPLPFLVKKKEF